MAQKWHHVLFAHWPISAEALRVVIPSALEIDTFEGQAWLGITAFRLTGARPRGLPPLPGISSFPELNVRTYVRLAKDRACGFSAWMRADGLPWQWHDGFTTCPIFARE